ncbi:MAG: flagellar biosynthetic protein FliO [Candidatus Margulisiibacteriota bacterium]|jgi:flagellar biogenesis protein FliO
MRFFKATLVFVLFSCLLFCSPAKAVSNNKNEGLNLAKLNSELTVNTKPFSSVDAQFASKKTSSGHSFFIQLIVIILVLVIIFGGGYFFIIKKGNKKEDVLSFFKIIDKLSFKKADLYLVELEGLLLVIGVTDHSINLIKEITEPSLKKKFLQAGFEKQGFSTYLNFFKKKGDSVESM